MGVFGWHPISPYQNLARQFGQGFLHPYCQPFGRNMWEIGGFPLADRFLKNKSSQCQIVIGCLIFGTAKIGTIQTIPYMQPSSIACMYLRLLSLIRRQTLEPNWPEPRSKFLTMINSVMRSKMTRSIQCQLYICQIYQSTSASRKRNFCLATNKANTGLIIRWLESQKGNNRISNKIPNWCPYSNPKPQYQYQF